MLGSQAGGRPRRTSALDESDDLSVLAEVEGRDPAGAEDPSPRVVVVVDWFAELEERLREEGGG